MIDVISFKEHNYPAFQGKGNAAQFAIPFAKHVCTGKGYDIGCSKDEWKYPGAVPIDYWTEHIRIGGTLFLYLPHKDQVYWRPWNNTKHNHMFSPFDIVMYMMDNGYKNIFNSERDLNHAFIVMGEKV